MNDKKFNALEVGDWVKSHAFHGIDRIARITKVTKTTYTIEVEYDYKRHSGTTERVSRKSGKQHGRDRRWSVCEDPDEARKKIAARKAEKAKAENESLRKEQERFNQAKAANPNLELHDMAMGLKWFSFVDGDGRENVAFFTVEERTDEWSIEYNRRFAVQVGYYGPIGHDRIQGGSTWEADTVEDALYYFMARTAQFYAW